MDNGKNTTRLWQGDDISWWSTPPYASRKLKVEHVIKAPLEIVWRVFNDFDVRKSYDDRYEHALIIKPIHDTCDLLYTAFTNNPFARVDFCDYRQWWTTETDVASVSPPPKHLAFGPKSHIAHMMVYKTAGSTFDADLPDNKCTRGETLDLTGMIFREFVSASNPREKWTRVVYPNACNFNLALLTWIPQSKYMSTSYEGAVEWRQSVDTKIASML